MKELFTEKQPSKEFEVAKHMVFAILGNNGQPTTDGIMEAAHIKFGNYKVLLRHLKAINEITGKAIEELEEEIKCQKNTKK